MSIYIGQKGSSAGRISGDHASLLDPSTPTELADYLDATNRPAYTDPSVGTTIYVDTTGNDITGDGTISAPFATIQRATQLIGWADNTQRIIQLSAGSFDLPPSIAFLNNVTIQGTRTVLETRNVTSSTFTAREGGVYGVDGATLANDAWRDKHLQITSTGHVLVTRNVGNTIYAMGYTTNLLRDLQFNLTGFQVSLLEYTTVKVPTVRNTIIAYNDNLVFKFVRIASDNSSRDIDLFGNPSVQLYCSQFELRRAFMENTTFEIYSSSYAGAGFNGTLVIGINSRAIIGVSSTYSDRRAGFAQCYINNSFGGDLIHNGLLFFRGLDPIGIRTDGGRVQDITSQSANISGKVIFDDFSATCTGFYNFNSQASGGGGDSILPELDGQTTANYIVQAQKGALVQYNSSSTLTTALGTNTVSANAGTSLVSSAVDGTAILNATPVYDGGIRTQELATDPVNPASGQSVIWQSNGTGSGRDGDLMSKVNDGSTTRVNEVATNRKYRPSIIPTISANLYVNNVTGNDNNDGLTSGTAVATIERALQYIPTAFRERITINIANTGTKYTINANNTNFANILNVRFFGTPTFSDTRNIVSVTSVSNDDGIVFLIDGAQIPDDTLAGRHLRITGVLSDDKRINVVRNTWNGSQNVIYGAMYSSSLLNDQQVDPTGGDTELITFPEIEITGTLAINNSYLLVFRDLNFTGDIIQSSAFDVQFLRCQMELDQLYASTGGIRLYSTSVNNTGSNANGVFAGRDKSLCFLGIGSTVIDRRASNPAWNKLVFGESSQLVRVGGCIFRGLNGIYGDAAFFQQSTGGTIPLAYVFENQSGSPTCTNAYLLDTLNRGLRSSYTLPESHGEITGNYTVRISGGSYAILDPNSSVTDGTGTNSVSADGGTSQRAIASDGTRAYGATPDLPAFVDGGSLFVSTTAVGNVGAGEDDLITYTMPAGTLFNNGDRVEVVAGGSHVNGTEIINMYIGSTQIFTHTFHGSGADWRVHATLIKSGATTIKCLVSVNDEDDAETIYTSATENPATALVIKFTGQGTSNDDIVQELMTVNYYANP